MPSNERFYPAEPDETYAALVRAVKTLHKFKGADDFSRAVSFATRASGFSWGANMSASVIPHETGAIVRVGGEAKLRTNITAKGAEAKRIDELLNAVGNQIQRDRKSSPGL